MEGVKDEQEDVLLLGIEWADARGSRRTDAGRSFILTLVAHLQAHEVENRPGEKALLKRLPCLNDMVSALRDPRYRPEIGVSSSGTPMASRNG
jgi:hypothetical protein